MKELEFFDAMTEIDDAYVLEAHETADHRSPIRFSGFRRAAVLAAAVMMLVVTTMATGDFGVIRPKGWVRGNSTTSFDMDRENRIMTVYDGGTYALDDGPDDTPAESLTRASAEQILTETECHGQELQIIQEAMILMDDGRVEYKAQITEGTDKVIAVVDNQVDGEPGEITNVRCTVAVLTEEADQDAWRQSTPGPDGKSWTLLQTWSAFLPTQLGYDYPQNVDFRFPDNQFNYDGRVPADDRTG